MRCGSDKHKELNARPFVGNFQIEHSGTNGFLVQCTPSNMRRTPMQTQCSYCFTLARNPMGCACVYRYACRFGAPVITFVELVSPSGCQRLQNEIVSNTKSLDFSFFFMADLKRILFFFSNQSSDLKIKWK